MMTEEDLARLCAHHNNIQRYRRLLRTRLTELERLHIEGRLKEERIAVHRLSSSTFPLSVSLNNPVLRADARTQ
jgi:hypothetical protein